MWRHSIMVRCVSYHFAVFSSINCPHFSLITWTGWQDVPGSISIHPPTRPCIPHAFWRTPAVHLTKREIEHLYFMERERVRVKWDRRVCFRFCAIAVCVSACGNDRQQITEAEAHWLIPAPSDWQRQTHHCFSSTASSVINPVRLILKVELLFSARSGSCTLINIKECDFEWFLTHTAVQFLS